MSTSSDKRNWKMRITDILDCIARIQSYTSGMSLDKFRSDQKTIDAVIRNFEIIGEAAGYIPLEIQDRYSEMAWLEMRGMRNIMVHEYFGVSLSIIWQTITYDLEPLAAGLQKILREHTTNNSESIGKFPT